MDPAYGIRVMLESNGKVSRKKLLIVAADALGWRTQFRSLMDYMKATQSEIDVSVIRYRPPPILRVCLKDVYVKTRRRRLGLFSSMLWAKLAFSRRLRSHVELFQPDSILFLGHFSAAGGLSLDRAVRKVMLCDLTVPLARRLFAPSQLSARDAALERQVAHDMDVVLGNTQAVADSFVLDHGVDAGSVGVCRPLIDLPAPQPRPAANGAINIGFVGHDFHRKGGHVLLKATEGRVGNGLTLTYVGAGIPPEIEGPGVRVIGSAPRETLMAEIFPAFDIFCLPTLEDANPLVLVEAASLGIPCVATTVGLIHELVRDGETGLLVPPEDPDTLAAALTNLAADPDRRHRMGQAGQRLMRDEFQIATNMEILLEALFP